MEHKGNVVENWDDSYREYQITYDERLVTPGNIANFVQFQFVYEDLNKFLSGVKDPKTLEVGCGGARTSLFLSLRGFDVTCADNSPEAIRLARSNFASKNARGTFILDDLLNSSLPEGSFDCVMSFGLLEHFTNIHAPIRAITKLLKPGGIHIHCVIPKKVSSQTLMDAAYFPARSIRNAWLNRSFKNIFRKSFRDFPHYENSFGERYYADVFTQEGCEVLGCEAGGFLYPFFALPFGVGNLISRHFSHFLVGFIRSTDRSQSRLMHFVSPTFYIVCRKKIPMSWCLVRFC